jgi:hypothetical protein
MATYFFDRIGVVIISAGRVGAQRPRAGGDRLRAGPQLHRRAARGPCVSRGGFWRRGRAEVSRSSRALFPVAAQRRRGPGAGVRRPLRPRLDRPRRAVTERPGAPSSSPTAIPSPPARPAPEAGRRHRLPDQPRRGQAAAGDRAARRHQLGGRVYKLTDGPWLAENTDAALLFTLTDLGGGTWQVDWPASTSSARPRRRATAHPPARRRAGPEDLGAQHRLAPASRSSASAGSIRRRPAARPATPRRPTTRARCPTGWSTGPSCTTARAC